MESQAQNPKFRDNPEHFHLCIFVLSLQIKVLNEIKWHVHRCQV